MPVLLSNALTIPVIFWNNEIPFKYENRHNYTASAREVYANQNKTRAGGFFCQMSSRWLIIAQSRAAIGIWQGNNYAADRDED
ncbi:MULTISPECIES: hypothetical protein [Klebsiella]|uniref:hypothetical protein n=1 Tax=Klebsiella TaxID=570 RepID=UPI0013C4005A|nr:MULTISPECIES: hypothetical protein [Klebsiella]MDL4453781.1 hypothetical protein [Klebsiella michiganensis]MDM6717443.1 hypothetical protein [Klebsiella michiganensis]MDM6913407.1 hypothetical protein [Klebsiella michiganensis]MDM6919359.1 hypothetical protein [Klebsiella michiganensis]MDM6926330.1 hypothetical protein [Klebsiella michiganensis]